MKIIFIKNHFVLEKDSFETLYNFDKKLYFSKDIEFIEQADKYVFIDGDIDYLTNSKTLENWVKVNKRNDSLNN